MTGRCVLESFSNVRSLMQPYRTTFRSMALDSGTFSNLTAKHRGHPPVVHLEPFLEFAQEHAPFYDWVASFDVIDGGAKVNRRNWIRMRDAGIPNLLPVFHQGEPWSLLEDYCAGSAWVGLGFQRPFREQERWLDECFSRIPRHVRVHGFAMLSFLRYPFWSVDSTTWLRELLDLISVGGQAGSVLGHLTRSELAALVLKKYERMPLMQLWRGRSRRPSSPGSERELAELLAEFQALSTRPSTPFRREPPVFAPAYHLSAECSGN